MSGFQNSVKKTVTKDKAVVKRRKQPYGRNLTHEEILLYGDEYRKLHRLWRQYNYDSNVCQSTISHRVGYIPESTYGLCKRTIEKCTEELNLIESKIDKIEHEVKESKCQKTIEN